MSEDELFVHVIAVDIDIAGGESFRDQQNDAILEPHGETNLVQLTPDYMRVALHDDVMGWLHFYINDCKYCRRVC
jgi:hypothetical protein